MHKHWEIQRRLPNDTWEYWAIPDITSSRAQLHERLLRESASWPTDMFRLVMVTTVEIEFAKGGDIFARS